MTGVAVRQPRKPVSIASKVMRDFVKTYADAVIPDMTDEQWQKAARIRRLTCLIRKLYKAFANDGITVTAAREMSVAVYLHIPDNGDLRSRVETFARDHFSADEVDWTEPGTLRVWWD